jgi:hypothetical protein
MGWDGRSREIRIRDSDDLDLVARFMGTTPVVIKTDLDKPANG